MIDAIKKIEQEIKDTKSYFLTDYSGIYDEQVDIVDEKPISDEDKIDFLLDLEIDGDDYCSLSHSQGYIRGLMSALMYIKQQQELTQQAVTDITQ